MCGCLPINGQNINKRETQKLIFNKMLVNTANTKTTSPQAATWFACGVMLTLLNKKVQEKFMC